MALQVVGAGLGRTGTLSLKMALEQIGYSPCYHMLEVFAHPEYRQFWLRAGEGEAVDWEEMFADFRAAVDWPSCHFYKEQAQRYPDAKVILTVRDPARWYESMQETILKVMQGVLDEKDPKIREESKFVERIVADRTFHYDLSRDNVIATFERHVAEVKRTIAPGRLLVYEVSQGWGPLCEFLGKPVPETPFPRTNSREEFWVHTSPALPGDAQ